MLRLDFSRVDLNLPQTLAATRRASISGVQDKVQLKKIRGGFCVAESGGDYILKPIPQNTAAVYASDIPVNEYLTMRIASKIFAINTAEHELVMLADGEYAYMTKRFDRRNGLSIRQEDFCQLAERTEETHGENYKYDASYEELAQLVRRYCPSHMVENPKILFTVIFNYVFSNGDAHLKNFSLYESDQGDYILTPAYDLLNTRLHFPNEPTATGLDFFADGHFTSRYEELGFYSGEDFVELGKCFGVPENMVRKMLSRFSRVVYDVEKEIALSMLSAPAKELYLNHFRDRLRAVAM